jgi:cytosine/adenosine deaminase-related metal-dependent hydrolase
MATRGGASVLGRDDIGYLAPGMGADFVAFPVNDLRHAGALHDPVAALVFCGAGDVGTAVIDGRVVVRGGLLATLDLGPHLETHQRLAQRLLV